MILPPLCGIVSLFLLRPEQSSQFFWLFCNYQLFLPCYAGVNLLWCAMSGVFRLHIILHFYFITMKLHLPKGLRTALMAVFAFTSVSYAETTSAPAVFDAMVGYTYETISNPSGTAVHNYHYYNVNSIDMYSNWVATLNTVKVYPAPCYDDNDFAGGVSIIGNENVYYLSTWLKNGELGKSAFAHFTENQFSIYMTSNGTLCLLTKDGAKKLGVDPNGFSWQFNGSSSSTFSLRWVVDEENFTGSLYFVGGSYADSNEPLSYAGQAILKDVDLSNYDALQQLKGFFCSSPNYIDGNGEVKGTYEVNFTYAAKGAGGVAPEWQITGQANLATLVAGGYMDVTSGTPVSKALDTSTPTTTYLYFIGDEGVLYTDVNAEISNRLKAQADMLNGGTTKSYGFGAAEGATLTVKEGATHFLSGLFGDQTMTGTDIYGLRIVGPGTVKMEMRANDLIKKVSIGEGTLNLHSGGNISVNVSRGVHHADSKLTHTGSGDMVVELDADTTTAIGTLTNDVNSQLTIGSDIGQGTLGAKEITSKGTTQVNANVVVSSKFASTGKLTVGGSLTAAELDADAAVQVGENATLTTGKADIAGNIRIDGSMESVGAVTIGGDAAVNGSLKSSADVKVTGDADIAGSVTMNGVSLTAKSVEITGDGSLTAAAVKVTDAANPLVEATAAGVSISVPNTSGVMLLADTSVEVLSGGVKIDADGIQAGSIADGASIEFDADSTGKVTTFNMANATIQVGSGTAGVEVTGAKAANSGVTFSAKDIAAGELEVETITVGADADFTIKANKLTAKEEIKIGGTTISVDSAIPDTVGDVVLENVRELSKDVLDAEKITADSFIIGDNYTLKNAEVDSYIQVGKGVSLQGVTLLKGLQTEGDMKMEATQLLQTGSFTDKNGAYSYVVGSEITDIILSGTQTDSNFAISGLVINAENIDFSDAANNGVAKEVLKSNTGYNCTLSRAEDYKLQINIESYVRAEMEYTQTGITITGTPDEEGIKAELMNSSNRRGAMKAINEVIDGAAAGSPLDVLHEKLGHVHRFSQTAREDLLSAISGASTVALADSQRRGVRDVQNNLRNRIIQMGGGTNAGLTTDWQYAGIQGWAQVDGGLATTSGSGDECGYDFNTTGATVGANLDLTANTVLGMSFSTSYGEIKSDGADSASGNNDTYYLSFFARNQSNRWVQMLILTAGMNQMDLTRNVGGFTGKGETEGMTLSAYYEVGYTFALDYDFNHILQPLVSVSFTSAKLDGYKETGSIGKAGIDYGSSTYTYGQVGLGLRYQGVLYESVHERSAVLEARARVVQDFGDTTDTATIGLLAGGDKFKVKGADTTGTGFEVGVGVSIPIEQHTTLFADADFTYSPDYTGVRANIGLRYDF